jgi:hypothetical protein
VGIGKQDKRLLEKPEKINLNREKLVHGDRKCSGKRGTLTRGD